MHRSARRTTTVFLLALSLAVPLAARPAAGPTPDRPAWEGLLATWREHLSPILALWSATRGTMTPDGTTAPDDAEEPPGADDVPTRDQGDSRAIMDPDG